MEVTSAATEIAASARQQEHTVYAFQESTGQAAAAVTEIAATGRELMGIVQDVNAVAQSTSDRATASRGRLTELDALLSSMTEATAAISERMDAIHARAGEITMATTAMTRVVDQTDLLSVNSAMEAEKAGEHGRGFRIVSREIRRLADQTAQATLEIEGIVTGIRESVSLGVAEAGRFGERMRTGIEAVRQIGHETGAIIADVSGLGKRFADVREMMEAQSVGSDQIRDSIAQLKDVSRQIGDSSAEFTQVTSQLQGTAERLRSQVSRFTVDAAVCVRPD
jgi:methyl-accepting chemotaxis protein WspA